MTLGGKRSTSFIKGDKRINRKGAPKLTKEVKEIRKLTKSMLAYIINKYLLGHFSELKKIVNSKACNLSTLEYSICKALYTDISRGELKIVLELINRLIGKVTEKIDHTTDDDKINNMNIDFSKFTTQQLLDIVKTE